MRASRVRCFLLSEGLNHYVAQVRSSADGTKITNTGTTSDGDPVVISARPPRPSGHFRRPRRLPRAQVQSATTEITVSNPGKAQIFVRDPRPISPIRTETKELRNTGLWWIHLQVLRQGCDGKGRRRTDGLPRGAVKGLQTRNTPSQPSPSLTIRQPQGPLMAPAREARKDV